tara:strand:- start:74 stop:1669 length:1596 start_codon:yes stop_codon:yes gene_type:complete
MDERISFEGIQKILNPKNITDFFWSIYDGGDHRYGRIFWNSSALFISIPYYLFGENSQVFLTRTFQVLLVTSSYLILCKSFIKNQFLRILSLFFLLSIPYNSYYMTMPKPEPIQLFLFTLFLYFFHKKRFILNKSYWIILGLSLGAKISILPIAIVFFLYSTYIDLIKNDKNISIDNFLNTFFYISFGLSIAVPILLPHFVISLLLYISLSSYFRIWYIKIFNVFIILLINLILSLYLFSKDIILGLAMWGGSTLLNSAHGRDNIDVNFFDWINYIFFSWSDAPYLLIIITLILSILILGRFINISFERDNSQKFIPLLLIFSGIFSSLIIFLTVQRLWGFYIFINSILIFLGILMIIDFILGNTANQKKSNKFLAYLTLFSLMACSLFWTKENINNFNKLSERTTSQSYLLNYRSYKEIISFLDQYKSRSIKIMYDPSLFMITNTSNFSVDVFWGYLTDWDSSYDVIILSSRHLPGGEIPDKNNVSYSDYITAINKYKNNVISHDECVLNDTCYTEGLILSNDGVILIKK